MKIELIHEVTVNGDRWNLWVNGWCTRCHTVESEAIAEFDDMVEKSKTENIGKKATIRTYDSEAETVPDTAITPESMNVI